MIFRTSANDTRSVRTLANDTRAVRMLANDTRANGMRANGIRAKYTLANHTRVKKSFLAMNPPLLKRTHAVHTRANDTRVGARVFDLVCPTIVVPMALYLTPDISP